MTTKGWLITGVAGISLLCGAGALIVTWAEGPAPASPGTTALAGPPVQAAPPAAPPAPPAPAGPAAPLGPAAPSTPPAPQDSLEEKVRALEPLRQEVFAGLAALDARVERCRLSDADLLLTLETSSGSVRVVDVQVAAAGAATAEMTGVAPPPLDEAAVACVRRSLRGETLRAPSAVAGRQWELHYRPGTKP